MSQLNSGFGPEVAPARLTLNRGDSWDERVAMMAWWSDYLDSLRKGADIVAFLGRQI